MNKIKNRNRIHAEYPDENFEKFRSTKRKGYKINEFESPRRRQRVMGDTHNFKCAQCGASVSASRSQSGVNNRNHCPHCLWSLHLDEKVAGDRKSNCQRRMEPIGITTKQSAKRYNRGLAGELMIVHRCRGCGKLSINRIAADDNPTEIYRIYQVSLALSPEERLSYHNVGITPLSAGDRTTIYSQLYGWQSILEEFISNVPTLTDVLLDEKPFKEVNIEK